MKKTTKSNPLKFFNDNKTAAYKKVTNVTQLKYEEIKILRG